MSLRKVEVRQLGITLWNRDGVGRRPAVLPQELSGPVFCLKNVLEADTGDVLRAPPGDVPAAPYPSRAHRNRVQRVPVVPLSGGRPLAGRARPPTAGVPPTRRYGACISGRRLGRPAQSHQLPLSRPAKPSATTSSIIGS